MKRLPWISISQWQFSKKRLAWEQKVGSMRVAVGSMFISSLTKHQVGWAEWRVAKWAGSSLSKTNDINHQNKAEMANLPYIEPQLLQSLHPNK
jgi:hypothetical protein